MFKSVSTRADIEQYLARPGEWPVDDETVLQRLIRPHVASVQPCSTQQAFVLILCHMDRSAVAPQHAALQRLPWELLQMLLESMQFFNCIGVEYTDNSGSNLLPHSESLRVVFRITRQLPTPKHVASCWYTDIGVARAQVIMPYSRQQHADMLWMISVSPNSDYIIAIDAAVWEIEIFPRLIPGRMAPIRASLVWHIEHVLCRTALHAANGLRKLEPSIFVE